MSWQVQEAKQRFSELVRRTLEDGPQVVTRHGEDVVVVIAARDFRRVGADAPNFAEFLLAGPDLRALELDRPESMPRAPDLGA